VSLTSPDAKAVVRAIDALTTRLADALTDLATQVKRAADYQQSDFALTPDAVDDAPTTVDDGPRCVCGDPIEQTGDPARWVHRPVPGKPSLDAHTVRPPDGIPTPWWMRGTRDLSIPEQAPPADEDQTLRWARRESLLVLVTRVQRGRALTEDEARTLREHVETEMREAEQARAKAGDLTETYKLERRRGDALAEERNQAWAAMERVRVECEQLRAASVLADGEPHTERERGVITVVTRVLAALDGTEQPTTEA
jgi:hypothetical protein